MARLDPIQEAAALLGGAEVFARPVETELDVHDALGRGLPNKALLRLAEQVPALASQEAMEKALGISLRTYQRRRQAGEAPPLSQEQSARAWQFARILAHATRVFGSQEAAESWLGRPAVGLDQRRPLDLMATPVGLALVEQLLGRIEHGVYA
jgi:putative toxin-antitoxin system antitoxin component (TIGR02293 family)